LRTDLLVVGEAFDDFVFHDLPHLPRLGEELKTESFHRAVGGGAIITATAARRLGTPTRVVSALSEIGEAHLVRESVETHNLRRAGEQSALTVALSTRNERAFVTFEGANLLVEDRLLRTLPAERARHLHAALAPRRPRDWATLFGRLRAEGTTVSWDFGWNPGLNGDRPALFELFSALDVLFVNEAEARLYSGREELDDALSLLAERAGLTIVKLGPAGCRWASGERRGVSSGVEVEALDTTGAGDAFDGAYLHARLSGLALDEALRLANEVGARSTLRAGGVAGLPYRGGLS